MQLCAALQFVTAFEKGLNENVTKSQKKFLITHKIQHIFNCISIYAYVFPEYLLHNFNNLSIKCNVTKFCRKCNTVHATVIKNYNKIKMCDLEPFSEIWSQILMPHGWINQAQYLEILR